MQQIYDIQNVVACKFPTEHTILVWKPKNISAWESFNNENSIFLSTLYLFPTDILIHKWNVQIFKIYVEIHILMCVFNSCDCELNNNFSEEWAVLFFMKLHCILQARLNKQIEKRIWNYENEFFQPNKQMTVNSPYSILCAIFALYELCF